jgi:hypothetical protein
MKKVIILSFLFVFIAKVFAQITPSVKVIPTTTPPVKVYEKPQIKKQIVLPIGAKLALVVLFSSLITSKNWGSERNWNSNQSFVSDLITDIKFIANGSCFWIKQGCIFNDWGNSKNVFYNPMGPGDNNFPKITFWRATCDLIPTVILKEKITDNRNIFKAAYPTKKCSMLYSLKGSKHKRNNDPRFIMLSVDAHGIEHHGKGGLNILNITSTEGDNTCGKLVL